MCRASVFRGNRAGSAAHYFVGAGAARHRDLEGTRRQDGCLRERLPVWIYELKFDGYRALAFKDGKNVRLISRNKKEFNYPQLLDGLKSLPADHVTSMAKLPRSIPQTSLRAGRKLRATYRRSLNLNRQTWPSRTMHSS